MREQEFGIQYWQLQDAKARLSKLVETVVASGPQGISIHGEKKVVIISTTEYEALTKPKLNLADFMQQSPLFGYDLDLERDTSPIRDVDL